MQTPLSQGCVSFVTARCIVDAQVIFVEWMDESSTLQDSHK